MQQRRRIMLAAAVLAILSIAPAASRAAGPSEGKRIGPFAVETLAEGIHLFRPVDEGPARSNSLVVEREDGVLVVDAQPTPAAAKELLQAIAQFTPKPLRFLVLSHPHADAAGGASAFPRDVIVIGTEGCREAMVNAGYDFGAEARTRQGEDWKEPERRPPTMVPAAELRLEDPKRSVEILPIQALPAHSSGDLVVWIRSEGVVAIGDLIAPSRAIWAKGADLGNWIGVLNGIVSDKPRIVTALRGPAVDPQVLRLTRDAIAWIRGRVQQSFVDHVAAGDIPDRVLESPEIARYFDAAAPRPFIRSLIDEAVREAKDWRQKHGFD
jgi:glyoxylase-like metal-dependent hydrolase (beta-lactamase superfamily II)